jgi:hypothetical protein
VLHLLVDVRGHEKRLRGDAAAQRTGAAQPLVLFDDGYFKPKLRASDGGHIAARPAPYNRDIKLFRCQIVLSLKAVMSDR